MAGKKQKLLVCPIEGERFFKNPFSDFNDETVLLSANGCELVESWQDRIADTIAQRCQDIDKAFQNHLIDLHDTSCYTGITGIGLLHWMLGSHVPEGDSKRYHLDSCRSLVEKSLDRLNGRRITFLCGDAGPMALASVLYHQLGDEERSSHWLQKVLQLPYVDECELLYGRAGYVYALLFLKTFLGESSAVDRKVAEVVASIFATGDVDGRLHKEKKALHYTWHGKEYIGAAHGYIGIMYTLLQAKLLCPSSVTTNQLGVLRKCIDWLLDLRYPSGNIPSSIGSSSDKLVHWCHGAPGAIHLFALANKIFKDEKYLAAAEKFGLVIWKRGLLAKGYGLCHGSSGNGWGFLCLFQATGKKEYLWKALQFAEWCLHYGEHACRTPDHPFSLFEGMAGMVSFLAAIRRPHEACFPAFQLVSYKD